MMRAEMARAPLQVEMEFHNLHCHKEGDGLARRARGVSVDGLFQVRRRLGTLW